MRVHRGESNEIYLLVQTGGTSGRNAPRMRANVQISMPEIGALHAGKQACDTVPLGKAAIGYATTCREQWMNSAAEHQRLGGSEASRSGGTAAQWWASGRKFVSSEGPLLC